MRNSFRGEVGPEVSVTARRSQPKGLGQHRGDGGVGLALFRGGRDGDLEGNPQHADDAIARRTRHGLDRQHAPAFDIP